MHDAHPVRAPPRCAASATHDRRAGVRSPATRPLDIRRRGSRLGATAPAHAGALRRAPPPCLRWRAWTMERRWLVAPGARPPPAWPRGTEASMSTTSATPEAIVAAVEAVYNAQEVERIMALFHPEIVFFWNGQPAGRGLAELRRWHEERFGRPRPDYRIRKRLHAAAGDALAVEWEASWTDPATNSEW